MRIAVSSTGPGLDAVLDPRFGRCGYFVIVDGDSMECDSVENPNVMAAGGAGIQSAQLVAEKGAEAVLTGHCGPNAFQTLQAAGIPVCVGASGTVRGAVELYKKGGLSQAQAPNAASKSGTAAGGGSNPAPGAVGGTGPGFIRGMGGGRGGGMGAGRGGGMGGGMGAGRGGGMRGGMGGRIGGGRGAGMGAGMGRWSAWCRGWARLPQGAPPIYGATEPDQAYPEDELGTLKAQADELKVCLDGIRRRIDEIEKTGGQ